MREKERERQREKQAPCREPDVGLDPWTPGSCPGLKAGAKPLSHPGIPGGDIITEQRHFSSIGSSLGSGRPQVGHTLMCTHVVDWSPPGIAFYPRGSQAPARLPAQGGPVSAPHMRGLASTGGNSVSPDTFSGVFHKLLGRYFPRTTLKIEIKTKPKYLDARK